MKTKLSILLLLALIMFGCRGQTTDRFRPFPSEERDGTRLSVLEIACSPQKTTVMAELIYPVDPNMEDSEWPSVGLFYARLINGKGAEYPQIETSSDRRAYDETRDRVVTKIELIVEGDACEADRLYFEVQLELLEATLGDPVYINLSGREIGDAWAVNQEVRADGAGFSLEWVKMTTRHQLQNNELYEYPALEFHITRFGDALPDFICVQFEFADTEVLSEYGGSKGCILDDDHLVSYSMIGKPVPVGDAIGFLSEQTEFRATGNLILGDPWRLILEADEE